MKKWLTILIGYISITLSYAETTDLTFKVDLANKTIKSSRGLINNIDFTNNLIANNKLNFNVSGIDLTGAIGKTLTGNFTYYCGYLNYYCNRDNVNYIVSPFTLQCTNSISLKGSVTVAGDRNNFHLNNSSIPSSTSSPFRFNIKSSDRYHIRQLSFTFDSINLADTIGISNCTGSVNIQGVYWLTQYDPKTPRSIRNDIDIPINNNLNITLNFDPYIKLTGQANYQATLTKNNHFGNDYGAIVTIPYATNANNIKVKLKSCTQSNSACVLQDERDGSNTIPFQLKINQQLVTTIGQEQPIAITQQSNEINVNLSADENTVKHAKPGTYKSKVILLLTASFN